MARGKGAQDQNGGLLFAALEMSPERRVRGAPAQHRLLVRRRHRALSPVRQGRSWAIPRQACILNLSETSLKRRSPIFQARKSKMNDDLIRQDAVTIVTRLKSGEL